MSSSEIQWWIVIGGFLFLLLVFTFAEKMPSSEGWQEALSSLNSRGGNIAVLSILSVYFFHHAMTLYYHLLDMVQLGTLKPDNAFALMGLQFVTTTAFGGFSGALLKTMTGENSKARSSDGNGNLASTTTDSNNNSSANNGVVNESKPQGT